VLSVDGVNAPITERTLRQLTPKQITTARVEGVGHLVAQEAPLALAEILVNFFAEVDRASGPDRHAAHSR